jgi:hypothetical protein
MDRELEAATAKRKITPQKEVVRIKDSHGTESSIPLREFQLGQLALGILKDNPTVQGFLQDRPVLNVHGQFASSPPSIEEVASALAEQIGDSHLVVAEKPVISPKKSTDDAKSMTFSQWFQSVVSGLEDRKTKSQFRKARLQLKDICDPLPPAIRSRFFNQFAEMLVNQSEKTVSNYVNAEQIVSDATGIVTELMGAAKTNLPDAARFESGSLFDNGEEKE